MSYVTEIYLTYGNMTLGNTVRLLRNGSRRTPRLRWPSPRARHRPSGRIRERAARVLLRMDILYVIYDPPAAFIPKRIAKDRGTEAV